MKIIQYSLFTNKELCYNIMFSGVIGAATLTMAWFVQPLLIELDTPTSWFGIIWTILNLTVGISALYSDKLDQRLEVCECTLLYYSLSWVDISQ